MAGTKSKARMRQGRPHSRALFCHDCRCWWVPMPTKVQGEGWALCSQCHDDPVLNDLSLIPWENRRIRLLGKPGEVKYERLHPRTMGDIGSDEVH